MQRLLEIYKKAEFGAIVLGREGHFVRQVFKNLFFVLYVLHVLVSLNSLFLNLLHRKQIASDSVLHELHLAKAAAPKNPQQFEVLQTIALSYYCLFLGTSEY